MNFAPDASQYALRYAHAKRGQVQFLVPLFNSHGEYLEAPLVAITDLITAGEDDTWKVTEFKTSGRAYGESEVATSLQPTCYVHVNSLVLDNSGVP